MTVKLNNATNERVRSELEKYPDFGIRCKLRSVLKDRGMEMKELSILTGIREASLSELANLKRSTINISHVLLVMLTLRINDMNELFEIRIPLGELIDWNQDQEMINFLGLLSDQSDYLHDYRTAKAEAKLRKYEERYGRKKEEEEEEENPTSE